MPYDTITELPKSVRSHLPEEAQKIYRAAFNNAWDEYVHARERRDDATREETAHRVAWAAVKQKFEKVGERWVKRAAAPPRAASRD